MFSLCMTSPDYCVTARSCFVKAPSPRARKPLAVPKITTRSFPGQASSAARSMRPLLAAARADQWRDAGREVDRDHAHAVGDGEVRRHHGGMIERKCFGDRPIEAALETEIHNMLGERRIYSGRHDGDCAATVRSDLRGRRWRSTGSAGTAGRPSRSDRRR